MTDRLDRFKSRVDQTDWQKEISDGWELLKANERKRGRDEAIEAIREVWNWSLYMDDLSAEDFIQQVKAYLNSKGN